MDVFKTLILDTPTVEGATGTVTSVDLTAGTGISVSGGPITSSGSITVTNTSPDQTVALTGGTGISTSGTYPNFTITNDAPDQTVSIASGTGISVTGSYPSFTVTNSSPSLGGDVVGPASSTDNGIVRFDGTTGKLVQDSGVSISDANLLTTTALTVNDNTTLGSSNTDTVNFNARVASDINPATDNTYDLGVTGHEWRNLNIDGTANIDSLVADTADINGGTIDGTAIGATTPSTVAGTTGTFSGIVSTSSDYRLNAASYLRTAIGTGSGWLGGYNITSSAGVKHDSTGAVAGINFIDDGTVKIYAGTSQTAGTVATSVSTFTSTGLNSTAIGATTPSTGAFTTLSATGAITGTAVEAFIANTGASANSKFIDLANTAGVAQVGVAATGQAFLFGSQDTLIYGDGAVVGTFSSTGLAVTGAITSTVANNVLTLRSSVGNATNKISFGTSGEWSLINYSDATGYLSIGQPAGRSYGVNIQTNGANVGVFTATGLAVTGAISQTSPAISINNASAGINFGSGATEQIYRTGSALGVYAASTTVGLFSATGLAVTGTISATARITTNESTTRSGLTNATITAINTSTAGSGSPSLYVENNSDTGYGAIYAYAKGTRSGISPAIVTQLDGTTTDYHIAFINDNGIVGSISTNGSATTYNTSSDYRLKEITGPVVNSGSFIDALKPKVGTWKLDGSKFVGFIAQELNEVFPEAVSAGDVGDEIDKSMASCCTAELVPVLVAEIQSLRKRLAALESK
jgi:hypothetical protein